MDIDLPFFMMDYISENRVLTELISDNNAGMLIEIILNFSKQSNLVLKNEPFTVSKLMTIISHFAKMFIKEYCDDEQTDTLPLKLVSLNKGILKQTIKFLVVHHDNLDTFPLYINSLNHKTHLEKRQDLENQLLQQSQWGNKVGSTVCLPMKTEQKSIDATREDVKTRIEDTKLSSIQDHVNAIALKYPDKLPSNLIIESIDNPKNKFVLSKLVDTIHPYTIPELHECLGKLEEYSQEMGDVVKTKLDELIDAINTFHKLNRVI